VSVDGVSVMVASTNSEAWAMHKRGAVWKDDTVGFASEAPRVEGSCREPKRE